jgi:ABC-type glycerol-3-phosphate transport system permease component
MYEHRSEPLASTDVFARRLLVNALIAVGILFVSLGIGMLGYHLLEKLPWLDALLNASMILGGMGPVNAVQSPAGKLFASFYALYCGVILLTSVGVLAAPIFHRFMHRFHLDEEDEEQEIQAGIDKRPGD